MRTSRIVCAYPLGLVHPEIGPEKGRIIIVVEIECSAAGIEEFSDIAGEIHRASAFDGSYGHFLYLLYRQIDKQPVMSVIDMAVVLYLIHLSIFAGRVVHHHDIIVLKVFPDIFVIERLRGILFGTQQIAILIPHGPLERNRRFPEKIHEHAVYFRKHFFLAVLQSLLLHSGIFADFQGILTELALDEACHLRSIVGRIGLRHHFCRYHAVFHNQVAYSRKLTSVAERISEQPVDGPVIPRKVACIYYRLKEKVRFFQLVIKEQIVLRQVEISEVVFFYHFGPQDVQTCKEPASAGTFLVGDSLCLDNVRKMGVHHCQILGIDSHCRQRIGSKRVPDSLLLRGP